MFNCGMLGALYQKRRRHEGMKRRRDEVVVIPSVLARDLASDFGQDSSRSTARNDDTLFSLRALVPSSLVPSHQHLLSARFSYILPLARTGAEETAYTQRLTEPFMPQQQPAV